MAMNFFEEVPKLEKLLVEQYRASSIGKATDFAYEHAYVRGALASILAVALSRMSHGESAEKFITEQIASHTEIIGTEDVENEKKLS